jgi:beta-glucosidase
LTSHREAQARTPGAENVTAVQLDAALRDLVATLDLETKVRLVSGAGMWHTSDAPQIGLSALTVSDGPIGVRGTRFAEDDHSAALPSPSAMSATWDEALLYRVGETLAGEAARKGVDVVLGPTINLHRSPLGGRHFECFSEDPLLSGRLATAYVRGLQDNGVGACPKHYVTNDAESERNTVDNQVDERTLRELYLAPFESVVTDASPWTIMAGYNATNGAPMSENGLLAEPLKGEWAWDGLVMSDWGGVYSTVGSAGAALDLAMPVIDLWREPLVAAVRNGEIPEATLDDKVLRLLRLALRSGALEGFAAPVPKTVASQATEAGPLARELAAAATVLLRNDGVLPLKRNDLRRVALLGPSAIYPRPQGGGSAMVFPPYVVPPLPALRAALGERVDVVTTTGSPLTDLLRAAHNEELDGTVVRWYDDQGGLVLQHPSPTAFLYRGSRALPEGARSVEITTRFLPPLDGDWRVGVSGVGAFELDLDGVTVLKESFQRDRLDMDAVGVHPPQAFVPAPLVRGMPVQVSLRYRWAEDFFLFAAGLVVQEPRGTDDEELSRAVALARSSDVAIVIVGTSDTVESEGHDRTDLRLPGRQDELVAAVAAANPRTVVVVNAGAPVEMPWRDEVAAVLVSWFPGMEAGNALSDVLLGVQEPGGRLPTTWPAAMAGAPVITTTPTEGTLHYSEGLHIGYRGYLRSGTAPAYWLGHGLGYTEWDYESLDATATEAVVRLRNAGERAGKEVVQVYTSRPSSALDRPARVLSGFAVVTAEPGEVVEVTVPIDPRTLRHWDVDTHGWAVEPGLVLVSAGRNAGDLPLNATTALP